MIRKTSETTPNNSAVVNQYNGSTTDTYSCSFINGTVLYENNSGSLFPIQLSDNYTNYRVIEIYLGTPDDSNYFNIQKAYVIPSVSGKGTAQVSSCGDAWFTTWITRFTISTNTITLNSETSFGGSNGTWSSVAAKTNPRVVYVYKVIGYK